MALILIFSLGINMVQLNKDVARCKKVEHKSAGCSIYKKLNVK